MSLLSLKALEAFREAEQYILSKCISAADQEKHKP